MQKRHKVNKRIIVWFLVLPVIPTVTKHLLSNPVFTCIILAACMEIAVVAGFAAFLGKYLEQQFNLTTTSANQLLGLSSQPSHSVSRVCSYSCSKRGSARLCFFKVWQPFHVRVWGSSWVVCWWRSSTFQRWEPFAWPCWSIWSPLPATSHSYSWAVILVPSQEWRSDMTTGKTIWI